MKDTESQIMFPERKCGANAFFFSSEELRESYFGNYFLKAAKSPLVSLKYILFHYVLKKYLLS